VNKVVETKASSEGTPPGNSQPPPPRDKDKDTKQDGGESKTVTETLEEVQEQAHPFN
jgi:hypothetical protein